MTDEVLYCSIDDVFGHGVARGQLVDRARLVYSVDVGASSFMLEGHALVANLPLKLSPEIGGSLPEPLVPGVVYYAKLVAFGDDASPSSFQVAAAPNGPAITLTTSGSPPLRVVTSLATVMREKIGFRSRWFDGIAWAQKYTIASPVPPQVRNIVSQAVSADMLWMLGSVDTAEYEARLRIIDKLAERVAQGAPLGDARQPASANLAVAFSASDYPDESCGRGVIP